MSAGFMFASGILKWLTVLVYATAPPSHFMDSRTTAPQPWFQVRRDSRARFRLFCFPYAGGSSSIYRPGTSHIHPDIEVVPALWRGREWRLREPASPRLDPLVEALPREIFPL